MLTFLAGLIRVIVGFLLACLAAGAVKVLFAVTPAELIDAGTEYWQKSGIWALYSATMIAIFASPFAALSAIFSEWQGIRSFAYHGFTGIAIAVGGFALIATGENPNQPSILNSYAMAAFLTTGLVSGFVYWLFAGRLAYRSASDDDDRSARRAGKPKREQKPEPTKEASGKTPSPPPTKPASPPNPARGSTPGDRNPSIGTVPAAGSKPSKTFDA